MRPGSAGSKSVGLFLGPEPRRRPALPVRVVPRLTRLKSIGLPWAGVTVYSVAGEYDQRAVTETSVLRQPAGPGPRYRGDGRLPSPFSPGFCDRRWLDARAVALVGLVSPSATGTKSKRQAMESWEPASRVFIVTSRNCSGIDPHAG